MKITTAKAAGTRAYRQGARAEAAAETHRRIVLAFLKRLRTLTFEEITLDSIASDSGLTVQTVIRRFENKEGLLRAAADALGTEIRTRRRVTQGDLPAAIRALMADYEVTGDLVIHLLAQEHHRTVRDVLEFGRKGHREWVEDTFRSALEPWSGAERERRVVGLSVLSDVYMWKLLRRDRALNCTAATDMIFRLLEAWLQAAHST